MKIADRLSLIYSSLINFWWSTVQWRIPSASFVFLTSVNILFWTGAFYIDPFYQFSISAGLSATLFTLQVVYPLITTTGANINSGLQRLNERYDFIRTFPTAHQLFRLACIPLFDLIIPLLRCIFCVLYGRFAEYVVMVLSGTTSWFLYQNEKEKACWSAYLTVLYIVSIPPWRHSHVSEQLETFLCKSISTTYKALNDNVYKPLTIKINHWLKVLSFYLLGLWIPSLLSAIKNFFISSKIWIFENIVDPIANFSIAIKNGTIYLLFGHWIPPLKRYICFKINQLRLWINLKILQPIERFLTKFKNLLVYCFGGHWIPPLLEKLKCRWSVFRDKIQRHYIDPFIRKMIDIKNFLVYWFLGYWIPPLIEKCRKFVNDCRRQFYEFVVKPTVDFFSDFTNNMIYVLTGKWLPGFLRFLNERVFTPIFTVIFRLIDLSIYICMGYFIPDLLRYVSVKRVQLRDYLLKNYMNPIKIHIIESAITIKRSIVILVQQTTDKIIEFVKRVRQECIEFYFELISLAKLTWRNLNIYMYKEVWLPTKRKIRRSLLRTKLYLKYKVLLPSIKNIMLGTIYSLEFLCVGILVPLCEFTVHKCHELLQLFMEKYGYQYWDWVLEQLPEKSPFCDDSDTELKDFLPSENAHESSDEGKGQEFNQKRQNQEFANDSAFSSTDEEAEFSRNLQMPSLEHADSDEEQELAFAPVEEKDKVTKSKRRKHPSTKNRSSSNQQCFSATSILPDFSSGFGSVISSAASYAFSKALETPSTILGLQSKRNNSEEDEVNADFEFLNDENDDS